jgi:uncharacterized protein
MAGATDADRRPADEVHASERLLLAQWRREVSELYARVRRMAVEDPRAAWEEWRLVRDRLYRGHASSPVPAERRATFEPRYFAYDPALRFEAELRPAGRPAGSSSAAASSAAAVPAALATLPVSAGAALAFEPVGRVALPIGSGVELTVFWLPEYSGGIFLPFRDATNGRETYGGGRYLLDTAKGADLGGDPARGTLTLDFNFAYQPSCAFDPRWSCPLSPPENRLAIEIRAGERIA